MAVSSDLTTDSASTSAASDAARPDDELAPRARKTRRRLLEAGLKLFAETGPRSVTTHEIAAEAGYASGTFYLHFKDKHALFRELAEDAAGELEEHLQRVCANKTEPADILYAQADALVGFAEEQRDLLRIMFRPDGEAGDIAQRILARLAAQVSARRRQLNSEGGGSACIHPDVLAQAKVGMWAHVLAWWAEDPTRASREELVETLTHFQLHGSAPSASTAPSDATPGEDFLE